MKAGIIQQANTADIQENVSRLQTAIRTLARQGAELIVMQELHNGLYFCQTEDPHVFELAETIPGPSTALFGTLGTNGGCHRARFSKRAAAYHNTSS